MCKVDLESGFGVHLRMRNWKVVKFTKRVGQINQFVSCFVPRVFVDKSNLKIKLLFISCLK